MAFSQGHRGGRDSHERKLVVLRRRAELKSKTNDSQAYWGDMHSKFQMSIPLKHQNKPVDLGSEFHEAMKEQYASMYLDQIGARTTEANVRMVLKEAPMEDAKICAAWKARGATSDSLVVLPHYLPSKDLVRNSVADVSGSDSDDDDGGGGGAAAAAGAGTSGDDGGGSSGTKTDGKKDGKQKQKQKTKHKRKKGKPGTANGDGQAEGKGADDGSSSDDDDADTDRGWGSVAEESAAARKSDPMSVVMGNTRTTFENLKRRYLYPFNAVPSAATAAVERSEAREDAEDGNEGGADSGGGGGGGGGAGGGGASATTGDASSGAPSSAGKSVAKLRSEALAQLKRPLRVSPKEVSVVQADFVKWFPVHRLGLPTEANRPARIMLSAVPMTRLVGLMAHLAYWELLRRGGDGTVLPEADVDRLKAAVLQTFGTLEMELQYHRDFFALLRSLVLLCLRVTTEAVLRAEYPLWFDFEAAALDPARLDRPSLGDVLSGGASTDVATPELPGYVPTLTRLDSLVAQVLDPSRLGSSLATFETSHAGLSLRRESRRLHTTQASRRGGHNRTSALGATSATTATAGARPGGRAAAGRRSLLAPPPRVSLQSSVGPAAHGGTPHPYTTDVMDYYHQTSHLVREVYPSSSTSSSGVAAPLRTKAATTRAARRATYTRPAGGTGSASGGRGVSLVDTASTSVLEPRPMGSKYKSRLHDFALQRLQTRYLAEGSETALRRIDILQRLDTPIPGAGTAATAPAAPPSLSSPAVSGAPTRTGTPTNPGLPGRPRASSLRSGGARVMGGGGGGGGGGASVGGSTARGAVTGADAALDRVDADVARLQQESDAFLHALAHRSWRYRTPFTPHEDDVDNSALRAQLDLKWK